jgi:GTPase SAR1 family protein
MGLLLYMMSQIEILLKTSDNGCMKLKGMLSFSIIHILKILFDRFANAGVCKILVGNKCDMEESRKVSNEEGMELAKHYEIPFLETSAKNSINVDNSFITMSNEIKKNIQNKAHTTGTTTGDKKGI